MSWTSRWIAAAPLALMLVGSGLQAQEAEFGVQGGLQIPMGDLGTTLDHSMGYVFGAHLGLYYGDGHEFRPRVDYQSYNGHYDSTGQKTDVSAWSLGADYVYYTEQRRKGLYLTMGLQYNSWDVDPGGSKSGVALAAGAGYRLDRYWSFEGRFTTGQFRSDNGQANALQAVALFHF
ncbi:outer membrane beta-barrel protein [Holophaga foetida]|uniref:outer membrane beta-barrel protein n=1 Tax=Holophaga foetida TaxID=35839 RepID=UPI0002472EE3|nr:outer membrane beta-barrel protein [Holophaga foetida]